MTAPIVDLSAFQISVKAPFGDPENPSPNRLVSEEQSICMAITAALDLSNGLKVVSSMVDERDAFRKAYLNMITEGDNTPNEFRVRINGIVKRGGVECLSVSVVGLASNDIIRYSEDLDSSPKNCGLLLFADADGEPFSVDDTIRMLFKAKEPSKMKSPVKRKPKTAQQPSPVLITDSYIRGVTISPDGKWIATTHHNQHLTLWDAVTGKACWSKRVGGTGMKFVRASAFSPNSNAIISGAATMSLFSVPGGEILDSPPRSSQR